MRLIGIMIVLVLLVGCAHLPPEAVRLNQMVNAGLGDMHEKHVALAHAFFRLKQDELDRWFLSTYEPAFRANYEKVWNEKRPGDKFDFAKPSHRSQYVQDVIAEHEEFANKLRKSETDLVTALDTSYADLTRANAAVTDVVQSATAVSDAQKQLWNQTLGTKFPQLQVDKLDQELTKLQSDAIKAIGGK